SLSQPEGAHLTLTMPSVDVPAARSTPPAAETMLVGGVPAHRRRKGRLAALAAAAVIIAAAVVVGAHALSHGAAPPASRVLYSFNGGSTDGWRAGANAASVTTVTTFQDTPGHPYAGRHALDAAGGGAFVPVPIIMTVTPVTPLNLSAAKAFFLYVDGFGYPPYAKSYAATVTLASGSHTLSKTVPVSSNAWNHVVVEVGSWSYRDHVTGVSVSYKGIASPAGLTTPWYAHFQIDDVGYTTG
ncbi:MAG: hypothetical protein ACRDOI_19210, partial [Trebonia sp.]